MINMISNSPFSLYTLILFFTPLACHPACWMTGFSPEHCCSAENPACFDRVFSFDFCCKGRVSSVEAALTLDALHSCLDREFDCAEIFAPWRIFINDLTLTSITQAHKSNLAHYSQYTPGILNGLAEAATECPLGTAAFLFLRFHEIEKEFGNPGFFYNVLKELLAVGETNGCIGEQLLLGRQRVELLDLFFAGPHVVFPCPANAPKFFLAEVEHINVHPYDCYVRSGFWASEVLFERYLRRSACRVTRPHDADLVFIPLYKTCYLLRHRGEWYGEAMVEVGNSVMDALAKLGAIDNERLVFLHGASSLDIAQFRPLAQIFNAARHMTVEPRPIVLNKLFDQHDHPSSNDEFVGLPLRNGLIIPPVVQLEMKTRLLKFNNQTSARRRFLASFHGSHAGIPGRVGAEYRRFNATLRSDLLVELSKWSDPLNEIAFGGVHPDYAHVMGNSVFCIVPKGSTSYTARLFESLFSGCIPVLLSDDYVFPFAEFIPWQEMVLRFEESEISTLLYELVEFSKNQTVLVRMQKTIEQYRCHVDWMEFHSSCSAYDSILISVGR